MNSASENWIDVNDVAVEGGEPRLLPPNNNERKSGIFVVGEDVSRLNTLFCTVGGTFFTHVLEETFDQNSVKAKLPAWTASVTIRKVCLLLARCKFFIACPTTLAEGWKLRCLDTWVARHSSQYELHVGYVS